MARLKQGALTAMPELPEVETVKNGLTPHLVGQTIQHVTIRQPQLRWPIPSDLPSQLAHQAIHAIERRSKYLLFTLPNGTLIAHLGMSGTLRHYTKAPKPTKHDHVDIQFSDGSCLRYNDPRRFGALLWTTEPPEQHCLLAKLGPEPLQADFTAEYCFERSRNRRCNIKQFIMNHHIVVGVGNIYANEALFHAGIKPTRLAGKITKQQSTRLVNAIKSTLNLAIQQGGTTLKDFKDSRGKPGYFTQELHVYGKGGKPCSTCQQTLKEIRINQRSTFFCQNCQR